MSALGHATQRPTPPLPCAVLRRFGRRRLLLGAGDPAQTMYLIHAGQVRVYQLRANGEDITTGVLGPGQVFGIAPVLGQRVHHAFAEAVTEVELWAMPAEQAIGQLRSNEAVQLIVLEALIRRFLVAEGLLADVPLRPVAERVPSVLERLKPCLGGDSPRVTRDVLAGLVGARAETIIRTSLGPKARARAA
jgi:CRP/FNR family cyclic AMP-dependent transcriptional regulator